MNQPCEVHSARIQFPDPALWELAAILCGSLHPLKGDAVECNYYSSGKAGVLVYTRTRRTAAHFECLFDKINLNTSHINIFRALLSLIPAETHAIRLLTNGGISLFFKIDLPWSEIATLNEALMLTGEHSERMSHFFRHTSGFACGMALELSTGGPRIRYYRMMNSIWGIKKTLDSVHHILGIDHGFFSKPVQTLLRLSRNPEKAVMNICADKRSGISVKFEFPQIKAVDAMRLYDTMTFASATRYKAGTLLRWTGHDAFSYTGLRCAENGASEFTFYIDVADLLGTVLQNGRAR